MELKRFFLFSFFTGRYRGLNIRENRVNSVDFIHLFSEFLNKILPILIKFNKSFQENVVDFTFEDKIYCRLFSLNFLSQISAKYFNKFRLFHQKQHEISFFSQIWLNLQEVHTQTPLTQSLQTKKRANSTWTSVESALQLKIWRFFLNFRWLSKTQHLFLIF